MTEEEMTERLENADMFETLGYVEKTLLRKNAAYGNSALTPLGLLTDLGVSDGLLIRMEDKLKRWKSTGTKDGEDTLLDLIGYTILLEVHQVTDPLTATGSRIKQSTERIAELIEDMECRPAWTAEVFRRTAWDLHCQGCVVDWLLANLDSIGPRFLAVELIRYYVMLKQDAYHERF